MKQARISTLTINIVLGLLAVLWFSPVLFTLFNSAKGRIEYNRSYFWDLPSRNELVENFNFIKSSNVKFFSAVYNSFIYSFCGALFAILAGLLASYALTHLKIKNRMFWFLLIYSGTVFPFQMYLIPLFKAYNALGLYDTKLGMILFYTAICIPFCMFVLRNFFMGIAREMLESARIDGATNLQILFRVLLPMSVAPLAVLFFTQFTWCWNDLMFGLTFTKSAAARPVMTAVSIFGRSGGGAFLLICLIASIPTLALFTAMQGKMQTGFAYQSK
jgi:multiple sugar transport system permease protein